MMLGFYIVISRSNMVKVLVGLTVFQTSVFIFYISLGQDPGRYRADPRRPGRVYSNPLTSVLILTAIVVSIATTALGLAIVVRINEAYGTIEEEEIDEIERVRDRGDPGTGWS
jgi:multicomponent Na+:H+ antiporter subunit C